MTLKKDLLAGALLLLATIAALAISNSPWQNVYTQVWHTVVWQHSIVAWINDGLMSLFFFQVGLELKRERYYGHLRHIQQIILPAVAALGGMVVPMLIYALINAPHPQFHAGWAIPMATDIAFALSVFALLGRSIPSSVKTFLLTLAILDDLGAIIVIAVFHAHDISFIALTLAALCVLILLVLRQRRVTALHWYYLVGIILWYATWRSGIHPTLAGVLLAFFIPLNTAQQQPLLVRVEQRLTPWVSFGILPLFAFANAGVVLAGISGASFVQPVTLGIILGLCVGKPLGIVAFSRIYARCAKVSDAMSWRYLLIVGCVAGIGFTMSLFLSDLSFTDGAVLNACRLGIISGSLLSAIVAVLSRFFLR